MKAFVKNIKRFFSFLQKRLLRFLSFPLYIHITIQTILLSSLVVLTIFIWIKEDTLAIASSIVSLVAGTFCLYEYFYKSKQLQIDLEMFKDDASHYFDDFKSIIFQHSADNIIYQNIEDKTIKSHLSEWQKYENIRMFEYQFIQTYIGHLCSEINLKDYVKIFLLHRIITSSYNMHFPTFTNSFNIESFFDTTSVYHEFIKILYCFHHKGSYDFKEDICTIELSIADINDTIGIGLKRETGKIKELLKDNEAKSQMQFLLQSCFENAYTNIGNIARLINEGDEKVTFLFKYDERFKFLKIEWKKAIKTELQKTFIEEKELLEELDKREKILYSILYPYPFSRALLDFPQCISQIGRDKFAYIIEPEHFSEEFASLSPDEFIKKKVINNAKKYLKEFNKELIKLFPYLKDFQKDTLDANYYLIYFLKKDFFSYAEQSTIPLPFQRLLVSDIINSNEADNHLASQLIYIKQVLKMITFSGLLFTEDFATQKAFRDIEVKLIKKVTKEFQLSIVDIYSISNIGNNKSNIISISYELMYNKKLQRKSGKDYLFVKNSVEIAIDNANKLINVFHLMKS